MLTPVETTRFRKDVKRQLKRGSDHRKLQHVASLLIDEQPLEPKYRDHKLSGEFAGHRECHIEPDWLLIYRVAGNEIRFIRTGTHADLLGE